MTDTTTTGAATSWKSAAFMNPALAEFVVLCDADAPRVLRSAKQAAIAVRAVRQEYPGEYILAVRFGRERFVLRRDNCRGMF